MMFKVLPLAILVSFLVSACFADIPEGCQKPDNAIDFNIGQLDRTIWFAQRFINAGGQFQYNCTMGTAEYVDRMKKRQIFKSFIFFVKSIAPESRTGKFTYDSYEISQSSRDHFILQDLKNKQFVHHAYTIRYDDFFVECICITKNGDLQLQGYIVWSKDGKSDKETLDQVVKDAKIEVKDTYEVYQGDDCLKYEKKD